MKKLTSVNSSVFLWNKFNEGAIMEINKGATGEQHFSHEITTIFLLEIRVPE